MDFTNLRYRSLVIESPDDPQFQPFRILLDQPVPGAAKGFGEESFTISVEAENQFVDFVENPKASTTTFRLDVDDVTLHRADGR